MKQLVLIYLVVYYLNQTYRLKKINMTIEQQIDIELILTEASAWGLNFEVEHTAKQYIEEGMEVVTAYQYAYSEWIK